MLQLDDEKPPKSDDDSSDDVILNIGWRRGQPPRSDVVVKFANDNHTAARATNKILVNLLDLLLSPNNILLFKLKLFLEYQTVHPFKYNVHFENALTVYLRFHICLQNRFQNLIIPKKKFSGSKLEARTNTSSVNC